VARDSQQLQLHQRLAAFNRDFRLLSSALDEAETSLTAQTVIPTRMADLDQALRTHKVTMVSKLDETFHRNLDFCIS
jgi:hypothetical protein